MGKFLMGLLLTLECLAFALGGAFLEHNGNFSPAFFAAYGYLGCLLMVFVNAAVEALITNRKPSDSEGGAV